MNRTLFYIYEVNLLHSRGYRLMMPVKGSNGKVRNIHRSFLTKARGEYDRGEAAGDRRTQLAHEVHDLQRPYPKKRKRKPSKRLFGVRRAPRRLRSRKVYWCWRASCFVGNRLVAVDFPSARTHPAWLGKKR
jgi:hypothetical protein